MSAPEYMMPGVYLQEIPSGVRNISGVATSVAAFVGTTRRGKYHQPTRVRSFGEFERLFSVANALFWCSPRNLDVREQQVQRGAPPRALRTLERKNRFLRQRLSSVDLAFLQQDLRELVTRVRCPFAIPGALVGVFLLQQRVAGPAEVP